MRSISGAVKTHIRVHFAGKCSPTTDDDCFNGRSAPHTAARIFMFGVELFITDH